MGTTETIDVMEELEELTARVGLAPISDFAFGPGDLLLVASAQGTVKLLDVVAQEEVDSWAISGGPLRVTWTETMPVAWLASGSDMRIWRLSANGESTVHVDAGHAVVPVAGGLLIGSAHGQHVYLEPTRRGWLREIESGLVSDRRQRPTSPHHAMEHCSSEPRMGCTTDRLMNQPGIVCTSIPRCVACLRTARRLRLRRRAA
jgi:hypothetical protein